MTFSLHGARPMGGAPCCGNTKQPQNVTNKGVHKMSTHRSKAYRAQQQAAMDIWETLGACYGESSDGYTPDIAERVATIHARLMDDKTGEYKKYLLDGADMLGLIDSAQEAYKSFIEYDLSAADFDADAINADDYDAM